MPRQATCADCYFACHHLCALVVDQPCPTFRPARPGRLEPPTQLRLLERAEPHSLRLAGSSRIPLPVGAARA